MFLRFGYESKSSYYTSQLSCAFKQRKGTFLMKEVLNEGLAVLQDLSDFDDELVCPAAETRL